VTSIVSKAIEKVFSSEREWNPNIDPDVRKYLRSVIDSLLNHLAESQDNVLVRVAPPPGSSDFEAWETGSKKRDPAADWLVPPNCSPEAVVLQQEQAALEDRALELLLEECADDPVLIQVLEAMMEGCDKPAEISEAKGIPVKDVYNAIRRCCAANRATCFATKEGITLSLENEGGCGTTRAPSEGPSKTWVRIVSFDTPAAPRQGKRRNSATTGSSGTAVCRVFQEVRGSQRGRPSFDARRARSACGTRRK
jgi:hypothetical protein